MPAANDPPEPLTSPRTAPPHAAGRTLLPGGQAVVVRSAEAGDELAIGEFLDGLPLRLRARRFFAVACEQRSLAKARATATDVDQSGLLAWAEDGGVVGHAAYLRLYGPRAEVAVEVADDYRPLGLAILLLARLARTAEQHAISHFIADVLPADFERLTLHRQDFDASGEQSGELVALDLPTSAWRRAGARR